MSKKFQKFAPIAKRIWIILTIIVVAFLLIGAIESIFFRIWSEQVQYTNLCKDLFSDIYKFNCENKIIQTIIAILIPPAGLLGMYIVGKGLGHLLNYIIYGKVKK
ncbi:hypothetical protein ACFL21_04125 [Patescibacteria group bacterium]